MIETINDRFRSERNDVKVNEAVRRCLENIVNENCVSNQCSLNAELRRRLPEKPTKCERTVESHLDAMLYSLKLAYCKLTERNRPDVIERHHELINMLTGSWKNPLCL